MKPTLLIVNSASGSAGAIERDELLVKLQACGLDIIETVEMPDNDIPDRKAVEKTGVEVVTVLSGDGTVASVCDTLIGWDGQILILPGGTMNLLSRRLHGELGVAEVLDGLAGSDWISAPVSVVKLGKREILTGLTAGPSTEWGKVREGIRQKDVADLVEKVPEAWSETVDGEGVTVEGRNGNYPSIFVEPFDAETLSVTAFKADGIKDMVAHGIAWLRGDFRNGPSDDLGKMPEVTIIGADKKLGLLVDGEQEDSQSPLICKAGISSVNFIQMGK